MKIKDEAVETVAEIIDVDAFHKGLPTDGTATYWHQRRFDAKAKARLAEIVAKNPEDFGPGTNPLGGTSAALVRQSALTACQQEVGRLTQERDELAVAFKSSCEIRERLVSRTKAAEAHNAELVKALEALCSYSDSEYVPNVVFAKARAALGGQSNVQR